MQATHANLACTCVECTSNVQFAASLVHHTHAAHTLAPLPHAGNYRELDACLKHTSRTGWQARPNKDKGAALGALLPPDWDRDHFGQCWLVQSEERSV